MVIAVSDPRKATPGLGIPLVRTADTETDVNTLIDVLLQGNVINTALTTPPNFPAKGDAYIVPVGATGVWAGRTGQIAFGKPQNVLSGVASHTVVWDFVIPRTGTTFWAQDLNAQITFNGSAWVRTPAAAIPTATPANSSAAGTAGQIAYDGTSLYVCVGTNSWRKVATVTF